MGCEIHLQHALLVPQHPRRHLMSHQHTQNARRQKPYVLVELMQSSQGASCVHPPLADQVVQLVGRGQLLQALCQLGVELGLGLAHLALVGLHVPAHTH